MILQNFNYILNWSAIFVDESSFTPKDNLSREKRLLNEQFFYLSTVVNKSDLHFYVTTRKDVCT